MARTIDLASVFATFQEAWQPRTVATLNDYDIRLVRVLGEFTRHSHPDTDELFVVLEGEMTIRMDAGDVHLKAGQLTVVPRGVVHQPVSERGAQVMLVEPSSTVNTGDAGGPLTAQRRVI
ncbi:MAG: cupin domain-containing protein [Myxococcaceae bacterium]